MQERLAHSRRAFHVGLVLMLAPGILSAAVGHGWGLGAVIAILTGGLVTLAARFWHQRLLRRARDLGIGFGHPAR
ncbi:MAG TPA: hypothetical protein VLM89_16835 [Phycisphaerae bacterium]|nr:hypothetical protein [Phycisphaerae bacterium]